MRHFWWGGRGRGCKGVSANSSGSLGKEGQRDKGIGEGFFFPGWFFRERTFPKGYTVIVLLGHRRFWFCSFLFPPFFSPSLYYKNRVFGICNQGASFGHWSLVIGHWALGYERLGYGIRDKMKYGTWKYGIWGQICMGNGYHEWRAHPLSLLVHI